MGWYADEPVQFLHLIRLQAILETIPGAALNVFQPDAEYVHSRNPPSRTGFLDYTFANGDRAVIHTHWNEHDKKLVSMHVQAGENGVEINRWNHFALVMAAVRDAHNTGHFRADDKASGRPADSLSRVESPILACRRVHQPCAVRRPLLLPGTWACVDPARVRETSRNRAPRRTGRMTYAQDSSFFRWASAGITWRSQNSGLFVVERPMIGESNPPPTRARVAAVRPRLE